jgi:hypothetical protein
MDFVFYILGGLLIVGVVVAIIEHRRKRVFLPHDFNPMAGQSEADREVIRAAEDVRARGSGLKSPHQ